jgi:hypothetical protein
LLFVLFVFRKKKIKVKLSLDMGHQPENRKLDFLLAADPSPPTPTAL